MKSWSYRALDGNGHIVCGELPARNEADLDGRLLQIGLQLIRGRPLRAGHRPTGGARVDRRELINFCFHLGQAHKAGLPIVDALHDLRDSTDHAGFRSTLAALCLQVENGKSLSIAMESFPVTFERVFVHLISAGEKSGELSQVLARMTETLKWQDELTATTRKLLLYPAFVGIVVMAVVFFLMLYVVPQMSEFLKNMGQEMPLHTRMLLAFSRFLAAWWPAVLAAPVLVFFAGRRIMLRSLRARRYWDVLKLRMWLIGPILQKIIMSRFVTYFQIMYASGINVMEALKTSRNLAGNMVVAEALDQAREFIDGGHSLSAGLSRTGLFPPLVVRMVKMGEDLGQIDETLLNVSYFYNREVREAVGRVQSLIEPVMTVVLGLILGWIMMSVLGPIYELVGNIGAGQ